MPDVSNGKGLLERNYIKFGSQYRLIAIKAITIVIAIFANGNVFNYRVKPRKITISNCDYRHRILKRFDILSRQLLVIASMTSSRMQLEKTFITVAFVLINL